MTPQPALFSGTGDFSAVITWDTHGLAQAGLRVALSRIYARFEGDGRVDLLIGVRSASCGAAHPEVLPCSLPGAKNGPDWAGFPDTQTDVLFQLAAPDRDSLLWGLRQIHIVLRGAGRCAEEILGGAIGPGREAFGFLDPVEPPTRGDIETALATEDGQDGSSWILYLRFQQDLDRFSMLRPQRQVEVIGRGREGEEPEGVPPDAHVRRMRDAGFASNRGMIRRGFPFRQSQEEGLAFIALSSAPETFSRALQAMLGQGTPNGRDPLLRYAHAVSGGVYLTPPREWFTSL